MRQSPREGRPRRDASGRGAGLLSEHDVATATAYRYTGLAKGDLVRVAAADGFDALVTADRNLRTRQNVPASNLAVVLVRGR